MKEIRYNIGGKDTRNNVYVDDLTMLRNNDGHIEAHIRNVGLVILTEIDGIDVRKPWAETHTHAEFDRLWHTDKEYRQKRKLDETQSLIRKTFQYIKNDYVGLEREIVEGLYIEIIHKTDKYDDYITFKDRYEELKKQYTAQEMLRKIDDETF